MTGEGSVGNDKKDVAPEASNKSDEAAQHDTLKYHLLGPSLTKAGQDAVDQRKVGSPCWRSRTRLTP